MLNEVTGWQIIGMKDGSSISNREITSRLISENWVRNTLTTFKTTGVTQRLPASGMLIKTSKRENSLSLRANPRLSTT